MRLWKGGGGGLKEKKHPEKGAVHEPRRTVTLGQKETTREAKKKS